MGTSAPERHNHKLPKYQHDHAKYINNYYTHRLHVWYLVQLDGAALGQTVRLVAVGTVEPLGARCDELHVPPTQTTPTAVGRGRRGGGGGGRERGCESRLVRYRLAYLDKGRPESAMEEKEASNSSSMAEMLAEKYWNLALNTSSVCLSTLS